MGAQPEARAAPKQLPRPFRQFVGVDLRCCTGCRACELACSWHQSKTCRPEQSHIRVYRDNRTGELEAVFKSTCDGCRGEEYPLCVRFCAPEALFVMRVAAGSGYAVPPRYP